MNWLDVICWTGKIRLIQEDLPSTAYLLPVTLYQLPITIYQLPTSPHDYSLGENELKENVQTFCFRFLRLEDGATTPSVGYLNQSLNQLRDWVIWPGPALTPKSVVLGEICDKKRA